jgi:acyl-CoA synthetase (AMP-forming)/AMP-acid ligase II
MMQYSNTRTESWLTEQLKPYLCDSYPSFLRKRMVEPNKPAVIFQDLVTTYRDLHDRIDATATKMLSHFGLSKGDRVVINM